jgi:branched-chain amino acid transport system substrate-binding protein
LGTAVAAVAVLLLAAAGCGSSVSASSSPNSSGSSGANGGLTGQPIAIGVALPDQGANAFPTKKPGLDGGLEYVNEVLGGVNGRPLKLDICSTDTTPSMEVNCANKFVSDKDIAVFDDYDSGFSAELPILSRGGLPIVGGEAADNQTNSSKDAFFFGPPNEAFALGPLQIFHKKGWNKINLTIANTPAAVNYVKTAINPVAKKLGMNVKVTYYPESSANFNVVASSLLSGSPDVTGMISAPESACTSLLKALRSAGDDKPILMGSCSAYVKDDAADAANTYSYSAVWLPSLASAASPAIKKQIDAYDAAMKKSGNADTDKLGQWAVNSFSGLVNIRYALSQVKGDITSSSFAQALAGVKDYQSFMGAMATCDHNQWPGTASCNHSVLFVMVNKDGKYVSVSPGGFSELDPSILG